MKRYEARFYSCKECKDDAYHVYDHYNKEFVGGRCDTMEQAEKESNEYEI